MKFLKTRARKTKRNMREDKNGRRREMEGREENNNQYNFPIGSIEIRILLIVILGIIGTIKISVTLPSVRQLIIVDALVAIFISLIVLCTGISIFYDIIKEREQSPKRALIFSSVIVMFVVVESIVVYNI